MRAVSSMNADEGLGAYAEGKSVGQAIARCIKNPRSCKDQVNYEDIKGFVYYW
jgi:hypothetical protein